MLLQFVSYKLDNLKGTKQIVNQFLFILNMVLIIKKFNYTYLFVQ